MGYLLRQGNRSKGAVNCCLRLKGSLTVEASLIMITVLSVMFGTMMAAFDIYEEGVTYIYDNPVTERDAPETFRTISLGKELAAELKGE